MSWVKDNFIDPSINFVTGKDDKKAAKVAAATQAQAGNDAIAFQREALETARGDLEPFREVGSTNLGGLAALTTDPEAQRQFITENPFFKALADDAQQRLFNNAAARGKVGSGGTAKALQNSLLLLGNDLLGQDINRRFNLATLGSNAAAGQATQTQQTGRTIADLTTQVGNVNAAGIVGAQNAQNAAVNRTIQTALALG